MIDKIYQNFTSLILKKLYFIKKSFILLVFIEASIFRYKVWLKIIVIFITVKINIVENGKSNLSVTKVNSTDLKNIAPPRF